MSAYLLDMIIEHIPASEQLREEPLQMQITSLDYSSYVGRIAVGRITAGAIKAGMQVSLVKRDGTILKSEIKELYLFEGLGKEKMKLEVDAGEICAVLGSKILISAIPLPMLKTLKAFPDQGG